jgi:ketosteroid isomerase-like protein
MLLELTPAIGAFFDASNRHDANAVAGCFTADGLVHDERADHRGRAAIREWAAQTHASFAATLTPRNVQMHDRVHVVTTGVEGTFPGSPIELQFRFVTTESSIAELFIG